MAEANSQPCHVNKVWAEYTGSVRRTRWRCMVLCESSVRNQSNDMTIKPITKLTCLRLNLVYQSGLLAFRKHMGY